MLLDADSFNFGKSPCTELIARDAATMEAGSKTTFGPMKLLRSIQARHVTQSVFVCEGVERHSGNCQVVGQHLAETAMRCVLFNYEQSASTAHALHKRRRNVCDWQFGDEPYLRAHARI